MNDKIIDLSQRRAQRDTGAVPSADGPAPCKVFQFPTGPRLTVTFQGHRLPPITPEDARALAETLLSHADACDALEGLRENRALLIDAKGVRTDARLVAVSGNTHLAVERDCRKLFFCLKTGEVKSPPRGFRGWRLHPATLRSLQEMMGQG